MLGSPGPVRGRLTTDIDSARSFCYLMYKGLHDNNRVCSGLLARYAAPVGASHGGQTECAEGEMVSGNYFDVPGVRPALGRLLTQEDDLQQFLDKQIELLPGERGRLVMQS